ncbi:MAG: cytochrome c oxidase subunit [Candidatus Binatota bacterium]|jgi:cytochrome c oxidase subunit 4|nr:cytochrome c oxidase subunit [Candidatus Binatota bacterium]
MTTHAEPNYNKIFWWLLALTIIEVGITYTGMPKVVTASLLISTALAKAALVALFFMHLRFESVTLGLIAVTPLVLCVFLLFMLMPDSNPFHRLETASPGNEAAAVE